MVFFSAVADIGLATIALYLLRRLLVATSKSRLQPPPGPKGLPILGNVADMPTRQEWKTFSEWGHTYGDLISLNVLGQPIVVLNSVAHARALLDGRSSNYSERPTLVMASELIGWKNTLALTSYGPRFRTIRRMLHRLMGSRPAFTKRFGPMLELETLRFLKRVSNEPENVAYAIRKTAGAIILKMSHGYQVKEQDDPIVACVDSATEQFSAATAPGAFLVDVIPWLRYVPSWMPGAGFQRKAASWRRTLVRMADRPHDFVKAQIAAGNLESNFTSDHLEKKPISANEEDTIKWAAASLYSGGADTTVSANCVFYLAMTLYPEVQKMAQAEIDSIIGNERLPTLDDRHRLPYVDALVKEVFRWQPVTPLGVPHRAVGDDIYNGYLISKNSIIIANIWQMLHDPAVYANPTCFNPARFLPSASKAPEQDPTAIAFGFGRRACPGAHLADASVWLTCAMSLAAFNITKVRDPETGAEITPETEMTSGTISHPAPFPCVIRPRSSYYAELIGSVEFAAGAMVA